MFTPADIVLELGKTVPECVQLKMMYSCVPQTVNG